MISSKNGCYSFRCVNCRGIFLLYNEITLYEITAGHCHKCYLEIIKNKHNGDKEKEKPMIEFVEKFADENKVKGYVEIYDYGKKIGFALTNKKDWIKICSLKNDGTLELNDLNPELAQKFGLKLDKNNKIQTC